MGIPRVVQRDKSMEIAEMITMILTIPHVQDRVDAIIAVPGLGEWWRISQAIDTWEKEGVAARHLFIAGHNQREATARPLTVEMLKEEPFNLRRCGGVHVEQHAEHTVEQAEWVVRQVREYKLTSAAIFVSPFHITRAYCTILKAFLRSNVAPIPLIPVAVRVPPDVFIPEHISTKLSAGSPTNGWDSVPGELVRIPQYQEKGHVASYDELRTYLNNLWELPLLYPSPARAIREARQPRPLQGA